MTHGFCGKLVDHEPALLLALRRNLDIFGLKNIFYERNLAVEQCRMICEFCLVDEVSPVQSVSDWGHQSLGRCVQM